MADGLDFAELVKELEGQLSRKLDSVVVEKMKTDIEKVFKKHAGPALKKAMLRAYDELATEEESQYPPFIKGQDPLSLKKVRHLFEDQLDRELDAIRFVGDVLVVEIGNQRDWGIGDEEAAEGAPKTVDFLGFYIEGVVGEWAFITFGMYNEFRGHGLSEYGRLGDGFLISKERYIKEGWEKEAKFEDVRHPISGHPPYNGFEQAMAKFDFSPYINKALQPALKKILNDTNR